MQCHAYPLVLEAAIFFFFQSKEVKIYFRSLFSLCKSHSLGSQVREKRKVKTEPGSDLWSSQRWEKGETLGRRLKSPAPLSCNLKAAESGCPYIHQEASKFEQSFNTAVFNTSMTREKSATLPLLWNCCSILSCSEMDMFCSKELGVPATWDFLVWHGWSLMGPWHLRVSIKRAKLIELRHFQEDQGHFRSVLILDKSALECGSY